MPLLKFLMKYMICLFVLLSGLSAASQDANALIEHEFDANLSLLIPENSQEGENGGQKFIQGFLGEDMVLMSMSNKTAKLSFDDDASLKKLFDGVRDGALRSTRGKLLEEKMVEIGGTKALNFTASIQVEGISKVFDSYVFLWNKMTYTLQFLCGEKESESFRTNKQNILESIRLTKP